MQEVTPGTIYVHVKDGRSLEFHPGCYSSFDLLIPHHKLKVDTINRITRAIDNVPGHHRHNRFWAQIFTETPACAIVTSTNSIDVLEKENPDFHLIVNKFEVYTGMILNTGMIEVGFHDGMVTPDKITTTLYQMAAYLANHYIPTIIPK